VLLHEVSLAWIVTQGRSQRAKRKTVFESRRRKRYRLASPGHAVKNACLRGNLARDSILEVLKKAFGALDQIEAHADPAQQPAKKN
jgi:hypothetical protein